MAWALQFDGVNDRADFTQISATGDFYISGAFDHNNAVEIFLGSQSNSIYYIANLNAGTVRIRVGSATKDVTGVAVATNIPFTIERIGTTCFYDINGITGSFFSNATMILDSYGSYNSGSLPYNGRIYGKWIFQGFTGGNVEHDIDASDHSNTGQQPVIIDTIGGNNATGVNFPTDGSAWVDLGGGSLDVNSITVNSQSVSNNPTVEFNSLVSVISQTVNSTSVSNNPSITFASPLNINAQTINSSSVSNDPLIQFNSVLNITSQTVNSNSVSNDPTILFSSELSVVSQTINSASISNNPLIELGGALSVVSQTVNSDSIANNPTIKFISEINITSQTINSNSISYNPTVILGEFDQITQWTVNYKNSGITAAYKMSEISVQYK